MLDYDAVIAYTTRLLREFNQILTREEQYRAIQLLTRVVQDGLSDAQPGTTVPAAWWKDGFFRSLEIAR